METKYCPRCKATKPLTEWQPICRSLPGGYQSYCRSCFSAYRKERRVARRQQGYP